ncbi:hypothetical protein BGZ74_009778 [Mortierella antarctica]|nr:hypothetical protein BGZ74_009775 [Mortierella antarctica]KAF9297535.1 hypothetical protein BGZ74_009778 [Mortierella antarctica]
MSPAPSSGRKAHALTNGIPHPIYPPPSAPPPQAPGSHPQQQQQSVYDLYDNHHNHSHHHNNSYEAQGRPSLSSRPVQDQSYNLHQHEAPASSTNSTPASWSDNNWRSIFDAALVKAQQAVQLDELKETALAANLYAQAANDLGRVIPMCGSEKKKQSMLAIQAIYLDRVIQLKAAAKAAGNAPAVNIHYTTPGNNEQGGKYGYDEDEQDQDQYQYQPQQYQTQPIPPQYQQAQVLPQSQPVQPPPPQEEEKGFKLFGKKRSKTQPSTSHPPDFSPTAQQHYDANFSGGNGYMPFGEFTTNTNAYISPPAPSPPPVNVSPIFMTHPPSTSHSTNGQNEQSIGKKSSKWKPFSKKKSKALSNGDSNGGAYQIPNDYQIPSLPLSHTNTSPFVAALPHQLVDPNEQFLGLSQQQSDWFVANDSDEYLQDGHDLDGRYYDDEDEDVDPYYIADTKGRARAFEGKDSGKKTEKVPEPIKEDPQPVKKKPTMKHSTSSYSNDQPFNSTFTPEGIARSTPTDRTHDHQAQEIGHMPEYYQDQVVPDEHYEDYDYDNQYHDPNHEYESHQHPQYYHQETTSGLQAQYPQEPTVMLSIPRDFDPNQGPESAVSSQNPKTEKKSKRGWFGKKKKDVVEKPADRLDEMARIMDEALFGGPSGNSSKKKRKDGKVKGKEKQPEEDGVIQGEEAYGRPESMMPTKAVTPSVGPVISPRKDSLTDYDGQLARDVLWSLESEQQQQRLYYPQQQQQPLYRQQSYESVLSSQPQPTMASNVLAPVPYTPKTTYTPSPKKLVQQPSLPDIIAPGAIETEGSSAEQEDFLSEPQEIMMLDTASTHDAKSITSDSLKKTKSKGFGLFKSKKIKEGKDHDLASPPFSPTSLIHDDGRSVHSENTHKSSIHSDRRPSHTSVSNKKRESDEYVPYEYQEEVEGPLMERVEVPENREVIGFVMPVQEIIDYTQEGNEEAALDSWDSWVSQLESFEKVLSDKGMKKDKGKKSKKDKDTKDDPSASSPLGSLSTKGSRSSFFSTGRSSTTLDLPSTFNSDGSSRPMSMAIDSDLQQAARRQSIQSSQSSGPIDTSAQQISVQQAKKRWWNPKRKEATSLYRVSAALSISDQDQERYLNSLLQSHDLANSTRADDELTLDTATLSMPATPDSRSTVSSPTQTVEIQAIRPSASSAPNSIVEKPEDQEPVTAKPLTTTIETKATPKEADEDEDSDVPIAPMPKPKVVKAKFSKPKLLPISTPLAQLLQLSNAEELWQYVQQAKTYATTRMNKGDKRSAAIALKRAQSLEARWQEILLEMASSDEEDDELLSDDDDMDDNEEEDESEEEEVQIIEKKLKKVANAEPLIKPAEKKTTKDIQKEVQSEKKTKTDEADKQDLKPMDTVAITIPLTNNTQSANNTAAGDDEDSEIDADEERKALSRKNIASRSDSAPDNYSKYKAANKSTTPASPNIIAVASSGPSQPLAVLAEEEAHDDEGSKKATTKDTEADGRLGPDATLEQMLESSSVEDLQFYIQRLKTATVAKARSGDKFAALEGMKNVKVLQQRLGELEEEAEEEEEEKGEDSDKE